MYYHKNSNQNIYIYNIKNKYVNYTNTNDLQNKKEKKFKEILQLKNSKSEQILNQDIF